MYMRCFLWGRAWVAVLAALAAAGTVMAQSRDTPNVNTPEGYPTTYESPGFFRDYHGDLPRYYTAPQLRPPIFMTSINFPTIYGAYSYGIGGTFSAAPSPNPTAAVPASLDARARINVFLPPSADLFVNGQKIQQTGASRQIVSPQLTPGQTYTYKLAATWQSNGQDVTRNKTVEVTAGNLVNVDFATPAQAPATPTLTTTETRLQTTIPGLPPR